MTPPPTDGLLKMSELAERSGVSAATIKHYLREGVLDAGEDAGVVRSARNMAWYPPAFVERIRLVKRLQEERFMPLRLIAELVRDDPERAAALLDVEDRIVERALTGPVRERTPREEVRERLDLPDVVLDRLEQLDLLSSGDEGYDPDDLAILEAIGRFRAGGYDEALGFTVYDALRYRDVLAPLAAEEVRVLLDRLAGEVSVDRAAEIIAAGSEPMRDLIGAIHGKLLLAELRRARERRR